MKKFYLIAAILFLIGTIGVIWNLALTWSFITIGSKIYSISSLLFQILLDGLFINLYFQTQSISSRNNFELDNIVEKYKSGN